jgi:hypothetical protein
VRLGGAVAVQQIEHQVDVEVVLVEILGQAAILGDRRREIAAGAVRVPFAVALQ